MTVGTSWRTSLAGLVTGLGVAGDAVLQAYASGAFTGKTGFQLAAAIGIILLGLYSKDKQVTGGTIVNQANDANAVSASSQSSVANGVPVASTAQPLSRA